MANRTLEEFYYGNLRPSEQRIVHGSKMALIVKELSNVEAELSRSLTPELQLLLDRLTKAQRELDGLVDESSYINGFKTGARFMMDVLDDTRENLKPITE